MSDFTSTIYAYHNYLEDGLFKNMTMPTGIDSDILIEAILSRCGEMCPIWTDPDFMQEMIGVWSEKWERTFEKWLSAYNATYNPIHNYDRHEDLDGWDVSHSSGTDGTEIVNTRSAYNSSNYTPHDKSNVGGSTTSDFNSSYDHNTHMYGNIGVTTTQQMLDAEYKIALWNIYENITDVFMQEFCIMLY